MASSCRFKKLAGNAPSAALVSSADARVKANSPAGGSVNLDSVDVSPELMAQTDELLSVSFGTLHHLPPACRKPLADAFAFALRRLHEKMDLQSAWLVVTFPKLVLSPLTRGGQKHNRQATGVILDRLRRWNAGAYRELVQQTSLTQFGGKRRRLAQPPAGPDKDTLNPSIRRAVVHAVTEAALSKAAKLLSSGSTPSDDVDALQKLHPRRAVPVVPVPQEPSDLVQLEFESSDIRRACKSFPPGSTGGPSGLRPVHLQEMLKADDDDNLSQSLASFVSDFNMGRLPQATRPWFCGARIVGLQKEPSGVRPVAIGEVLRRLAGKCLVNRSHDEVLERLLPHQMGVGVPNAAEIIAHAARAWAAGARADESLIMVDFANAFNTLDRQKMLEAIAVEAPVFLPYANYCYGAETPLRGKDFQLWSSEGTQQGDCCGPLFFSVTLQRLLRTCCPQSSDAWNRWYLDDGTLCGKTTAVESMFGSLVLRSPEIGLVVNISKCKQWGPVFSGSAVAPNVPWEAGVKVLGVPIGSDTFTQSEIARKLSKLDHCFSRLKLLDCSFSAFHILRSCLSACKVMFLLRTLPFHIAESLSLETQNKIRSAFGEILGIPIDPIQWSLTCLPARRGGLGMLDPQDAVAPAHISSFLTSSTGASAHGLPQCPVALSFFRALASLERSSPAHVTALRALLRVGSPVAEDLAQRELFDAWSDQHAWTEALHDFTSNVLNESLPRRMRFMRELTSAPHAGSWLLSPSPRNPSPKWATREWQALLLWRLGASLELPIACVACGACQDSFGDHALSCSGSGLYKRHNVIRDTIAVIATSMGLACRTEEPLPGSSIVPADVFLPAFTDTPTAVDVFVVHPLHPSHCAQAAMTAGAAAEARAVDKVATYSEECRTRSWDFWAVGAETTGAWNQAGQLFVRRLARARALRTGEAYKAAAENTWMSLSRALARAVARQLVRARQFAPSAGGGTAGS